MSSSSTKMLFSQITFRSIVRPLLPKNQRLCEFWTKLRLPGHNFGEMKVVGAKSRRKIMQIKLVNCLFSYIVYVSWILRFACPFVSNKIWEHTLRFSFTWPLSLRPRIRRFRVPNFFSSGKAFSAQRYCCWIILVWISDHFSGMLQKSS